MAVFYIDFLKKAWIILSLINRPKNPCYSLQKYSREYFFFVKLNKLFNFSYFYDTPREELNCIIDCFYFQGKLQNSGERERERYCCQTRKGRFSNHQSQGSRFWPRRNSRSIYECGSKFFSNAPSTVNSNFPNQNAINCIFTLVIKNNLGSTRLAWARGYFLSILHVAT